VGAAGVRRDLRGRRVLAIFLGLHALAHLVGTELLGSAAGGESVELLGGAITADSPTTLRLLGIGWILLAVAFLVTAALTWMDRSRWPDVLGAVATVSLVFSVLLLWASTAGVVINAVLIAVALRAPTSSGSAGR
jgi:hypothetical protein